MKFSYFLYILPFIFFFSSYFMCVYFFDDRVIVPNLVGHTVEEALFLLEPLQLSIKISKHVDKASTHTEIINQSPSAGHHARSSQTVNLIVAKPLPPPKTPLVISASWEAIQKEAEERHILLEPYWLYSLQPRDTCFAQSPSAETVLGLHQPLIVYLSKPYPSMVIMPSFIDQPLSTVLALLGERGITPEVIHSSSVESSNVNSSILEVKKQRPQSGALIDFNQPVKIQLLVQ